MPTERSAAAASTSAPGGRPYTVREQVTLRRLGRYVVSPDGTRVVLTVAHAGPGRNRLDSQLWIVNADGSGLRRLNPAGHRDSSPVFAPDGRSLFFLSGRAGANRQVVRTSLDGSRPEPVTVSPVDVDSFVLSRDGTRVAFAAAVFPGGPDTLAATVRRQQEAKSLQASGRTFDKLFIRHWDEWKDGTRRHLFVQNVAGGPTCDVMPEMDADAPVKPFGGSEQFTFTPDGTSLVFTARDAGREEAWSTNLDLFIAPVDGSAAPRNITPDNLATDTNPAFSPDGGRLAYLAMDRPGNESDKQTVLVREWPGGATRRLTDHWDRSAEAIAWSIDGRTLYAVAEDFGQRRVFAIDVSTGSIEAMTGEGWVEHIVIVGETVFYSLDSLGGPADLYAYAAGQHRRVTRLNAANLRGVAIGEAERFSFAGWNDETVHGYVVKPANFDPNRSYPIAFLIHGGPEGCFGNDWHYRWNPQVYAGAGYAVVMIDFHGSTGYGRAFTDSIRNDWGGKPLEDLKRGYAAALERYPFLDRTRAAALGASFGGYMINYLAGVWNEPWRCLVSHDGNIDERFDFFATEELWFAEWEHGGTPWDSPESYTRHNPIDHVADWRVPMLVVHGALDYRVSEVQGFGVFTALQRLGVPSKLLYFPDENHWVSKPLNSIQWHDTVIAWLDQWTGVAST